jgi:F0F1-type ATP synthase membrane subunit c/vacuolar-type H+-ATPase subunit K
MSQIFASSAVSDPNFVKGMTIMIGTIMPAFSLGWIGSSVMKAVGRNPEAASKILPILLISSALVEAIAIYVLVVVFTIS